MQVGLRSKILLFVRTDSDNLCIIYVVLCKLRFKLFTELKNLMT